MEESDSTSILVLKGSVRENFRGLKRKTQKKKMSLSLLTSVATSYSWGKSSAELCFSYWLQGSYEIVYIVHPQQNTNP